VYQEFKNRWAGRAPASDGSSPFGNTEDGRADFRGADLSGALYEHQMVQDVDIAGANIQHARISDCSFENCVFDGADLRGTWIRQSSFRNCSFRKSDLRMAALGIWNGLFDQCIFEGVRTQRTSFHNPVFRGTKFLGKDWSHSDFSASGFWDCAFVGQVTDVMFRGTYQSPTMRELGPPKDTGLHRVSFADAELLHVGLTDECVLDHVIMPKSGSAFECATADLLNAEEQLQKAFLHTPLKYIPAYFKMQRDYGKSQVRCIVSKHDLVKWETDEHLGAKVYEFLKDLLAK
jgi:hypothetical protein